MLKCSLGQKMCDSIDYPNYGPKNEIFWVFSRTFVIDVLWRQSMLKINVCGRKSNAYNYHA